ncbi:MAG: CDP-alcohol phosphatidyltransferase family protein [Actinobacteria bacterium]|nr:CDP-alcohol phosphatidyltransferase family protein [Actinomycetota bacterium]
MSEVATQQADSHLSSHRFLTAPNVFTLLRLCCLPVFLYLLLGRDNRAAAAWLLGGLGATDWVDGWLARRFDQVSEFGKVFDPTVDRLLFIVSIAGIIIDGAAPLWFVWLVVAREVTVGLAMAIATLVFKMQRFDVAYLGKAATLLLMFAVPGFVLGASDFPGNNGFQVASWILGIPGLVLSYWVAITYIPAIRDNVRAGRAARESETTR